MQFAPTSFVVVYKLVGSSNVRMETLARANVVYDAASDGFLVAGRTRRGLTPLVRALVDVPRHVVSTRECAGCRRQAAADAYRASTLPSRKRDRGAVDAPSIGRSCFGGRDARAHGRRVDADITQFTRTASLDKLDPCSVTLLAHLARERLRIVGTQVPIASERLQMATAIDVLALDEAGGLHLIEVKAARLRGVALSAADGCYQHEAGVVARPLAATCIRASTYRQHQLQLWAMADTLRREYGLVLASASVLRTSPTAVFTYALDARLCAETLALELAFRARHTRFV